jgi:hypothetical protein
MDIHEIFQLQDRAARVNLQHLDNEFRWCRRAIELALDSHVFLANNPQIIAYRKQLRDSDAKRFDVINVVVNLAYDAMGTLISALRLLEYGILADAWSLIRGAFESTCYAEFFSQNPERVPDYIRVVERIERDRSLNVRAVLEKVDLQFPEIRSFLEKSDQANRKAFYSTLSTFGTHALPFRAGFRMRVKEPEVRAYLSIRHRDLMQCVADFAATTKYTLGIPFEAWPDLMPKEPALVIRYKALEEEYQYIFSREP